MIDSFNRAIDYLRVSVTDRCNFRCTYCMPDEGVSPLPHAEILSYEEILRIIRIVGHLGVRKVRLTGGEPLVRKGITGFISRLTALNMITDLSMTTNGSLLSDMAQELKKAGLQRVNISLDTANPEKFALITRRGRLEETLSGVKSALAAGLTPVKLNVVLSEHFTDDDLIYFVDLIYRLPVAVRFIEYMPIGADKAGRGYSIAAVKEMVHKLGKGLLQPVTLDMGNGPARYYRLPGALGSFGFITPISEHFCGQCNRLRLTADGKFKPCLLSNTEIDVKTALRSGATDEQIKQLFLQAVRAKPSGHNLCPTDKHSEVDRRMSQIGG
ncbi:MAG: GTP 3',8-cyclase MoaA [Negativicutes bacterium]